jgi:hypothetical protein
MDTSAPSTFNVLKIPKPYAFMFLKNYGINYVDIYVHEKCIQKGPGKKYFKF